MNLSVESKIFFKYNLKVVLINDEKYFEYTNYNDNYEIQTIEPTIEKTFSINAANLDERFLDTNSTIRITLILNDYLNISEKIFEIKNVRLTNVLKQVKFQIVNLEIDQENRKNTSKISTGQKFQIRFSIKNKFNSNLQQCGFKNYQMNLRGLKVELKPSDLSSGLAPLVIKYYDYYWLEFKNLNDFEFDYLLDNEKMNENFNLEFTSIQSISSNMAFDTVTKEITIYSNVSLIDLSLDSFNLNEIQAFNSFYNNLFFFEWYITLKNSTKFYLNWLDKIYFKDENNTILYTSSFKNSIQSLQKSTLLIRSVGFEDNLFLESIRTISLTIDATNLIDESNETNESNVKNIYLNETQLALLKSKNVLLNDKIMFHKFLNENTSLPNMLNTFTLNDIIQIQLVTRITTKIFDYDKLSWKDCIFFCSSDKLTKREEILKECFNLECQFNFQPILYGKEFNSNIKVNVPYGLLGRSGYLYLVNDINKSIFDSNSNFGSIYEDWLSLLSSKQILFDSEYLADLAILNASYHISTLESFGKQLLFTKNRIQINFYFEVANLGKPLNATWKYKIVLFNKNKSVLPYELELCSKVFSKNLNSSQVYAVNNTVGFNLKLPQSNYSILFYLNSDNLLPEKEYLNNKLVIDDFYFKYEVFIDLDIKNVFLNGNSRNIKPKSILSANAIFEVNSLSDLLSSDVAICIEFYLLSNKSFDTSNKIISLKSIEDCNLYSNLNDLNVKYSKQRQIKMPIEFNLGVYYLGVSLSSINLIDSNLTNNKVVLNEELTFAVENEIKFFREELTFNSPVTYAKLICTHLNESTLLVSVEVEDNLSVSFRIFARYEYYALESLFDYFSDESNFFYDSKSNKNIFKIVISNAQIGTYYLSFINTGSNVNFNANWSAEFVKSQINDIQPNKLNAYAGKDSLNTEIFFHQYILFISS